MNTPDNDDDIPLDDLIGGLRDRTLDDGQLAKLTQLIEEDPAARRRLAEHMFLIAALEEELLASPEHIPTIPHRKTARRPARRNSERSSR